MIKNAMIYKLIEPVPHHKQLIELLNNNQIHKPDVGQLHTIGFALHPTTNQTITEFKGGYCLTVKEWEKKIDNAAVNACLSDRVITFEDNHGRGASKSEKQSMKEAIVSELLPNILPTPKTTFVYFTNELILIDSVVDKTSEAILALLRKTIGTLKVEPVFVDNEALTYLTSRCFESDDRNISKSVAIGLRLELKGDNTESVTFNGFDLFEESTTEEIVSQINEGGMYVKTIELVTGKFMFKLTDGVKLKSLNFGLIDYGDVEDAIHEWEVETLVALQTLLPVVDELVETTNNTEI